jgi:1,4-dihydroxy-2-naphthoate octaprenyltransferase
VVAAFVALAVGALSWRPPALLGLVAVLAAIPPVSRIRRGASGPELIAVLGATGRMQLAFGVLTTIGLIIGG